jgi:hypothetical protein
MSGPDHERPLDLSVEMIQQILRAYGEFKLAEDVDLMNEMVQACYGGPGQPARYRLDQLSFVAGLTSDIELLDLADEGSLTTNLADVLRNREHNEGSSHYIEKALDENASTVLRQFHAKNTRHEKTYSHIDTTAGNMRSKSLIILLWATFAVSYFTFSYDVLLQTGLHKVCRPVDYAYKADAPWADHLDSIGCESVISIITWLFYFIGLAGTCCYRLIIVEEEGGIASKLTTNHFPGMRQLWV